MLELLDDYGLAVQQVADIFGRDRRRCRPSVLRPSTETRPVKIMVPVVILPGNQFAWDFSHWIGQHAAPRAKKPFHPGQWIREIPEETVRALSEDERKALRKRLRMQLARL